MKQKAGIIIGDSFTFPDGDAATNRVYTYAKGLMGHNIEVHVICFRNDYLDKHAGETEGIRYYHPFAQTARSPWFIVRRWNNIRKFFNTLRLFSEIRKEYEVWLVMAYTIRLYTQVFAYLMAKMAGATHVLERSEHPFKSYKNKLSRLIFGRIRVAIEIIFSDRIFCISDYLMDFYRERGASVGKLFKVPSTVDPSRFSGIHKRQVEQRYICYSGSLTLMKDGVDILLRSFSRISPVFPDLLLILVGKADTVQDEHYFRNMVADLNIKEKVIFTGKIPRDIVPSYVCNAHVLALARPRSIVADAGFPSKVSEYLSTGIPVVVTNVGEIPVYLTDNQNAFLSEPDSAEEFAAKLKAVLYNYPHAREVGLKGQEIALGEFNYLFQAQRIIGYLAKSRPRK
ncbi:MAG: glycosyltransferase family 4 protein [Bacteroidales bacterium]|nr:glycosyltransferase family 4 protein [Bacteroidales bacterium]